MIKLNVTDRSCTGGCYYSGGFAILILDDDVRCRRTETGLQLVELTKDRVHDFNKQGEYIGSSPA